MQFQRLKAKLNQWKKPALYIMLAVALQLSSLSYLNHILAEDSQPIVDEKDTATLVERQVRLANTLAVPSLMSISPDKTLLALRDADQLKVYSLKDGKLQNQKIMSETDHLMALQWLPDRNRLIYAIVHEGGGIEPARNYGPEDTREDPHSRESLDEYRKNRAANGSGFQIALYSMDFTASTPSSNVDQAGSSRVVPTASSLMQSDGEHIQTLSQEGKLPQALSLYFSTYTNLLYVHWTQEQANDSLAVVDIMKRIKDIRLPTGQLTKLTVMPKTGDLWSETANHNGYTIYSYQKGRWHAHKELDGYRLLGAAENDQPVLGLDQQDWVSEISVLDRQGSLEPTWAFQEPVRFDQTRILANGSLMRIDTANQKTGVYLPKNKGATVYPTAGVSSLANDGKMLLSWQQADGVLKIYEEVQE